VRPRTINREYLLDLAGKIVSSSGAGGLTFGSLANEAGLSKASIQSAFGTREALIEAMLDRWITLEKKHFEQIAGATPSHQMRVSAHIATTAEEPEAAMRRVAALLAALAGKEHQIDRAVEWYASRIDGLNAVGRQDRGLRLAFLATEGAFFMRYFVGFPIPDAIWLDIFNDLKKMSKDGSVSEY